MRGRRRVREEKEPTWRRRESAVDQTAGRQAGRQATNRSRSTRPPAVASRFRRPEEPRIETKPRPISPAEPPPGRRRRGNMETFGAGWGRDRSGRVGTGRAGFLPSFGLGRWLAVRRWVWKLWVGAGERRGGEGEEAECVKFGRFVSSPRLCPALVGEGGRQLELNQPHRTPPIRSSDSHHEGGEEEEKDDDDDDDDGVRPWKWKFLPQLCCACACASRSDRNRHPHRVRVANK
ncbi:hypothetical protein ZWY2020_031387 [Hordeum vulgare]|nr:hypothetical protein ZWY2020_031387 [Hordeum vulgare]